jgi:hypothetical protein
METKTETKKEAEPKIQKVTADVDVDFPSLNWAISAGTTKELPADVESQKRILANHHIKLIK